MRIKSGYILREIMGQNVIIPIGERVIDFKGMMMPNDTGSFIWKQLISDITYEQLLKSILDEYEIDGDTAKADLDDFLAEARKNGVIEE
jgi:hypothetical protein